MSRRIPILLYHRVGHRDGSFMDDYTVSPGTFAQQMGSIRRRGWQPVPLADLLGGSGTRPSQRSLVITFDDGFASNRDHAWPILREHGFPSATFVVTRCLGGFNFWDGPSRAQYRLLSAEDLVSAERSLMTFYSHTETHPDLTLLPDDAGLLRKELRDSRRRLTALVPSRDQFLAYPRGSWNWAVMEQVRDAGYVGACTCMPGLNTARTNPFLLRRTEIREHDVGPRLWAKIQTGRDLLAWPPPRPATVTAIAAWLRHLWKSSDGGMGGP